MTSNAASLRTARVVAPATPRGVSGRERGFVFAMGNLLCPPYRPTRFPYDERRRWEYERRARSAERAFPGGERGVGEDGRPTLLPEEVNRLPIEQYHSPEEMSRWDVKRLKFHLKQARANSPADRTDVGQVPLEKAELLAAVRAARGGETGESCSICMDTYEEGDAYRVLPCGHRFHIECVDKWLRSTSLCCPLCNHDAREKWRNRSSTR